MKTAPSSRFVWESPDRLTINLPEASGTPIVGDR